MSHAAARKDAPSVPAEPTPAARPVMTADEKQRWIEENREAFAAYDAMVEKYGIFGEEYRQF